MRHIPQLLLIALLVVGCGSHGSPATPSASPAPTAPVASGAPTHVSEEEIYPAVPRHPAATTHQLVSEQRSLLEIRGEPVNAVLDWYASQLEANGWKREPTVLPGTMALLFSRDGRYLSIAGHQSDPNTLVWFHLRGTPEVTLEEAVKITSTTHKTLERDCLGRCGHS